MQFLITCKQALVKTILEYKDDKKYLNYSCDKEYDSTQFCKFELPAKLFALLKHCKFSCECALALY